jgi:Firmicute plasmid replication protein (RepL)
MATLERIETSIDTLTGEVLSSKTNIIDLKPMEKEPAYIKMYIDDLSRFCDLTDGQRSILLFLAASADYEGIISLTAGRKSRIAITTGCTVGTISNAITDFCKKNILKRIGGGEYELNPHLFARGKWRQIRERREKFFMTIAYSEQGGRVIETTNSVD